jgi:hypothetical protein
MSADAVARSRHRYPSRPARLRRRLWYTLLLVEFVAVLIPSLYAREDPKAWGIPFFYWYQFAWIIGSAILTAIVYWATSTEASRARRVGDDLR